MNIYLDPNVFESMRSIGGPDDQFVFDIYRVFVEQSEKVLAEMTEADRRADLLAVKRLAHRLNGSAANLGALALSSKAALLEHQIDLKAEKAHPVSDEIRELTAIFAATHKQIQSALTSF